MRGALVGMMIALALGALGGCQKKEFAPGQGADAQSPSTMGLAASSGSAANSPNQPGDTLAYEHTVSIDLGKDVLPMRLRAIEAACTADTASRCAILESSLQWQAHTPSASIRMRLAPGGVDGLISLASKDGKIVARTTHAEDLAQPVADTERSLALLSLHRDRLADFMKNRQLTIDQLMTVSKELASVQSQIDSLGSQHANLLRRIDTDLLTIELSPPALDLLSESTPVRDALRNSASGFLESLALVILFLAAFVPWLFVIVPGLILFRLYWRRTRRQLA